MWRCPSDSHVVASGPSEDEDSSESALHLGFFNIINGTREGTVTRRGVGVGRALADFPPSPVSESSVLICLQLWYPGCFPCSRRMIRLGWKSEILFIAPETGRGRE